MIGKRRSTVLLCLAATAALYMFVCFRTPLAGSVETGSTPAMPETQSSSPGQGKIEISPVYAGKGQKVTLGIAGGVLENMIKARVSQDGESVEGAEVTFEIHPSKVGEIVERTVLTDKDGIARTTLKLGHEHGDFVISATCDGTDGPVTTEISLKVYKGMWIYFLLFGTLGGLAIFLFGMEMSAEGLQKAAGDKMRNILGKLTSNRVMGVLVGALVTGAVQSSSATTVMVVGFVTATLMTLPQAIGVIMGANVGTTLTVQLIAFNIADYAPLMIGLGFFMGALAGKKQMLKSIGAIILGFGFIFYGMGVMSTAMKPLRSIPAFTNLLSMCGDKPALGILVASVFTAVVQSSGATIGIAIALAASGVVTLPAAIAISFGANVGTCATAMLSSLGASRDGKRVAVVHLIFNVVGVLVFYPFLGPFAKVMEKVTLAMGSTSLVRQIANAHMFFNIINTILFLPFVNQLAAIAKKAVPEKEVTGEEKFAPQFLGGGLNNPPDIAIEQGFRETVRMGEIVETMLKDLLEPLMNMDKEKLLAIKDEDDKADILEEALTAYFSQVSRNELSKEQTAEIICYMYAVDYLENIGDVISKDIFMLETKFINAKMEMSPDQRRVLEVLHHHVIDLFEKAMMSLKEHKVEMAEEVMLLYKKLKVQVRKMHLSALQSLGKDEAADAAHSAVYFDIIEALRGIASSVNQIAHSIVEQL